MHDHRGARPVRPRHHGYDRPLVRAVGYAEMVDHRFLTPERDVQQTRFGNGVTVTVNFGDEPFLLPGGTEVKPMGFRVRKP